MPLFYYKVLSIFQEQIKSRVLECPCGRFYRHAGDDGDEIEVVQKPKSGISSPLNSPRSVKRHDGQENDNSSPRSPRIDELNPAAVVPLAIGSPRDGAMDEKDRVEVFDDDLNVEPMTNPGETEIIANSGITLNSIEFLFISFEPKFWYFEVVHGSVIFSGLFRC